MTNAPNYAKEPWKHPAVWNAHVVRMTGDGKTISIATCECGWNNTVQLGRKGGGRVAQDDAVEAHWHSVIAAAVVPA